MYPKEVKAFTEWAKAMVAGATVERPKLKQVSSRMKNTKRRKRRFRKRRWNRQKEE